jgi:helicase
MNKSSYLIDKEPSMYEPEYDEFLNSIKTALMFNEWVDEMNEEYLLEEYGVRPGEIRAKLERADWLLYSTGELCKLLQYQSLVKHIVKLRLRMKYGAKEELLPLLRLQGVGRVRARALFRNKIKDIGAIKNANLSTVKSILGEKTAFSVKKQVGEEVKEGNLEGWN